MLIPLTEHTQWGERSKRRERKVVEEGRCRFVCNEIGRIESKRLGWTGEVGSKEEFEEVVRG